MGFWMGEFCWRPQGLHRLVWHKSKLPSKKQQKGRRISYFLNFYSKWSKKLGVLSFADSFHHHLLLSWGLHIHENSLFKLRISIKAPFTHMVSWFFKIKTGGDVPYFICDLFLSLFPCFSLFSSVFQCFHHISLSFSCVSQSNYLLSTVFAASFIVLDCCWWLLILCGFML